VLLKEDKGFLTALDAATWKRWVPAIIGHPFPTMDDEEETCQELLGMIHTQAPEEMVKAIKLVLEKEDKDHKTIFVLRNFQKHWTEGLAAMLLMRSELEGYHSVE
jgi:hypothetical protein